MEKVQPSNNLTVVVARAVHRYAVVVHDIWQLRQVLPRSQNPAVVLES